MERLFNASIHDEVVDLKTDAYFIPKDFSQEVAWQIAFSPPETITFVAKKCL